MGSVRRAIGLPSYSPSGTYDHNTAIIASSGRSSSLTRASIKHRPNTTKYPRYRDNASSRTCSSVPRRSASDAAFWKSKRGARDWEYDGPGRDVRRRSQNGTAMDEWDRAVYKGAGGAEEEDEWDVEAAAENRVVQLMFTVPKEKLRVVNCDVDGRSLASSVGEKEGETLSVDEKSG